MRIIYEGTLRKMIPDAGYKIYSQHTNDYHDVVYLGKNDDGRFYTEVPDPNKTPEEVESINDIINNSVYNANDPFRMLIDIANDLINK